MYMYKVTAGIWCTLSFLIVTGSVIAFFMPYWLVRNHDSGTEVRVSVIAFFMPYWLVRNHDSGTEVRKRLLSNLHSAHCPLYDSCSEKKKYITTLSTKKKIMRF